MAFRESNPVFLEILGEQPRAGVPIELDIFDGSNPETLMVHLDAAEDVKFQQTLDESGAGSFRVNRHNVKATPEVIDRENLAKVKVGGVYRFSFWMENRKVDTLSADGEQGDEYWFISGREGGAAYLDRAAMAATSEIGDDPQEGTDWPLHLAGTGTSLGAMFNRCLQEAFARDPSPLEFMTTDFGYVYDSQGNLWSDTAEITVHTGDSLLDIYRQFTALGLDGWFRHDLMLRLYVERGRHFDVDTGNGSVVLRAGRHIAAGLTKTRDSSTAKSRLWVKGSGTILEVIDPTVEANPHIRRREGVLSFGNSSDPTTLQRAGMADIAARTAKAEGGLSLEVSHDQIGDFEPFVDYDIGDWVSIHDPGVYDQATFRIVGWTFEQYEGTYRVVVDFNSIEWEDLIKLARKVQNGSSGASSTSNVSSTSGATTGMTHPTVAAHVASGLASQSALDALAATVPDSIDDLLASPAVDGQWIKRQGGVWVPTAAPTGGGGGGKGKFQSPPTTGLLDQFSDGAIDPAWALVRDEARLTWAEQYGKLTCLRNTAVAGTGGRDLEAYIRPIIGLAIGDYIECALAWVMQGNYFGIGLVLSDGAAFGSGAQVVAWFHQSGGMSDGAYNLRLNGWSGFNAQSGGDGTQLSSAPRVGGEPHYIRIKWEAANTFGVYWSADGIGWRTVQTNYARTLTPTHAGVVVVFWDNPNTAGQSAGWYYFGRNMP